LAAAPEEPEAAEVAGAAAAEEVLTMVERVVAGLVVTGAEAAEVVTGTLVETIAEVAALDETGAAPPAPQLMTAGPGALYDE
jgi:hypothetical protein